MKYRFRFHASIYKSISFDRFVIFYITFYITVGFALHDQLNKQQKKNTQHFLADPVK